MMRFLLVTLLVSVLIISYIECRDLPEFEAIGSGVKKVSSTSVHIIVATLITIITYIVQLF